MVPVTTGAVAGLHCVAMDLGQRIESREARVSVIGLGYVGLPLSLRAVAAGFAVTGLDVSEETVAELCAGRTHLTDMDGDELRKAVASGRFAPTTDAKHLAEADVVVICVPTPLRDELPDMRHVEAAARAVAQHLHPGELVVLESTTYPGTTEELMVGILEESGLKAGEDFLLGFSPERIDPGNERFGLTNVPKIIGGLGAASTDVMEAFYGALVERVVRVSSPRTAEMVKLLENTYRHVNLALINELSILAHDLDIDIWEVVDAAATKPFGFQAFYPGPGWGGHCIPVDPAYLSWRVRQDGGTARFVELAREINKRMPAYVVQRIGDALNDAGRSLKGSSVLVLGVTYKRDVADLRESSAIPIIERLCRAGALVRFSDPYIHTLELKMGPLPATELTDSALVSSDIVLVHTDHSSYEWPWIAAHSRLILDSRNAMQGISERVVKL
jgi:UDP-N-acetyl-D-glucosamine dehydrogenase